MRKRSHRSRAGVALAAAAVLGLAACDASGGGGESSPRSTTTQPKPSPRPSPLWDRYPGSIAAVGDSITRGFDACTVLSDCPEVSWATGSDAHVDSLAVRLLGASGASLNSWNFAVTGARMSDLAAQMEQAAQRKPELVTVMVGANDACRSTVSAMTSVTDFRAQFKEAMDALRGELPRTQVYVSSMPNLKRLWSQGRTSPIGKQVWKLGICPSMLGNADALDAAATDRRAKVQARVEAYNRVLKDVCGKDRRCRFDGNAVFDYRFDTDQLSQWDWFHPSRNGQARLAEIAYRTITAKDPVT
ncbi:SGNH/GDSL hydrolase family protein [Streptomyces sp. NPDC093676]|uniref:SGNH/GDSL hydrolase family protein n=1 Tax=Streptomyces sp. NPDC093676 TaxID=3366050 RepID=UPI00380D240C